MRYAAVVEGVAEHVEVEAVGPGAYAITLAGERVVVEVPPGRSTADLAWRRRGRVHAAHVERRGEVRRVHDAAGHVDVEVLDLRRFDLRRAAAERGVGASTQAVRAPMPGKVVAVLVGEGDQVAAGAGLVVVEAMKMENELRAPHAGTVTDLSATVGAAVEGGEPLCRIV